MAEISDSIVHTATGSHGAGALYVVATPIGNLDDISARAVATLKMVDLIAAEDTRHSARLLAHLGVRAPLLSLHDHNERARAEQLGERIARGERVALISDAGTPLISDPGYRLVNWLRERGLAVIPLPGACALITALSAAGLPTDRFRFEGFLPAKRGARRAALESLRRERATLAFYESPHRIEETLEDLAEAFGERRVVLARELTKRFETFLDGDALGLLARMREDPDQARGEFVVMVEGAAEQTGESGEVDGEALLAALAESGVGVKQAAAVAARLLGGRKQEWYARAQSLKEGER